MGIRVLHRSPGRWSGIPHIRESPFDATLRNRYARE
jgi:hypothetical protein